MEVSKTREVQAPIESVWKVIADIENEHKYWPILKSVKILRKTDNYIEREAKIRRGPMGEAKSVQTLSLDPVKRSTMLTMTDGPMLGTRRLFLSEVGKDRTQIEVKWKFEMKGVPSFAMGFVKDNISDVTEKSLDQIAEQAKSK